MPRPARLGWVELGLMHWWAHRYGNPAFRTWHARSAAQAADLLKPMLPPDLQDAARELGLYLSDSLGGLPRPLCCTSCWAPHGFARCLT